VGLVLALSAVTLWRSEKPQRSKIVSAPPPFEEKVEKEIEPPAKPIPPPPLPHKAPSLPRVAIVIDDLGYQKQLAADFIALDIPLTLSFLPQAPFAREMAQKAAVEGKEVLLHLPMEPKNFPKTDPGPSALLTTMTEEQIRQILEKDFDQIPQVRGVNNHMGSLFTENQEKMALVLKIIKQKKLYFFDSRTTPDSVALSLAGQLGVRAIGRDVFLDNVAREEAIRIQLDKLIHVAQVRGLAVACAHPHPETLRALKEMIPELKDKVHLVPLSNLL
jgi:uncharacterized protein